MRAGSVANAVKRSYSRFILIVESRQLADGLDVGDERNEDSGSFLGV